MRRNARAALGSAVALGTVLALGGAALADDPGPAYPSKHQVDQARADVAAKQHDVASVRAQYAAAQSAADRADQQAEMASEAYNEAMWKLSLAHKAADKAGAAATAARQKVEDQRNGIAALVVQSYQEGTSLNSLTALLGADGPESVMGRTSVVDMAGDSLRADYDRYTRLSDAAKAAEAKAAAAEAAQEKVARQAKDARAAAAGAATRAEHLRAAVATRRTTLVHALATAEHTSVALANQRQHALDEIARKKAEAAARAAAEKKRREEAAKAAAQGDSGGAGGPAPGASAPPAPSGGGVAAAIAFAKAQLGEAYLWAAAGPDRWDCSGLTMMAWRAGGISLPHFSGAQYAAGTPIPISSARPGDLLFWSYNGRPSGIHHVALYLGGGAFIEAPHTGADVRYNSISDDYPNFAVRL